MAAWQVQFSIVPRRAFAAASAAKLRPSADADWWSAEPLPSDFQRKIASVAALAPSSSAEVQTWGTDDGNRIDVWSAGGRATMVTAHVDVRRLDSKFGAMLLQFAKTADAVLVRSDGLVVEPLVGAYAAALRGSKAWKYANDPAAHFASYRDPAPDDE